MTTTSELLDRLFRPAEVLVVDGDRQSTLSEVVQRTCACKLHHLNTDTVDGRYDVVLVENTSLPGETLSKLREAGPVVLVGRHEKTATREPVAVMPEITEKAVTDLFRMLKIRMRTPAVAAAIESASACGSFA